MDWADPGIVRLVEAALPEDLGSGDCTARALVPEMARGRGEILAGAEGVVAGLPLIAVIYRRLGEVAVRLEGEEGDRCAAGRLLAVVEGNLRALLAGERTVLNFLQRMGGVATLTRRFVEAAKPHRARIFDTRKTCPGWRLLDKYAVRTGGGCNHRMGLHDQVLIKRNYLGGLSVGEGIRRARREAPGMPVEAEVASVEEAIEAAEAGADIVMLDNFDLARIAEAVRLMGQRKKRPELEVSGGVRLEEVARIAGTGVDRISVGVLTHSAPALDLRMAVTPC
jgi:nicotinate-nucleotide pyrophosphorylase (carboxylating)